MSILALMLPLLDRHGHVVVIIHLWQEILCISTFLHNLLTKFVLPLHLFA